MSDPSFETELTRLFSETPSLADERVFADRIATRLRRGWALRRLLIFAAGVGGGLIAVAQMMGLGLWDRLTNAVRLVQAARQGASRLPLLPQFSFLADMPFGGEVVWLVVGLAVLAVALWAGRSLEDF